MNTRELPDYIIKNDDYSLTVMFSRPHKINGVDEDAITLREALAIDQKKFAISEHMSASQQAQNQIGLIAHLAGCNPDDISKLPLIDYNRTLEAFSFFTA